MRVKQRVKFFAESGDGEAIIKDIMRELGEIIAVYVETDDKTMHRARSIYDVQTGTQLWSSN